MSYTLDDLNYIFTREGHQDEIDRAMDDPTGFVLPTQASDGGQQASSQPSVAGVVQEQINQPNPITSDPRFEMVQRQVQSVVQERDQYRDALGHISQQQFLAEQRALQAQIDAETDPKRAAALVQQNAQNIIQNIANQYHQENQQLRQAVTSVLVDGFTQTEVFAKYPNLTDEQRDLLNGLPNPDDRAKFAAVFNQLGQNNQQNAATAAAALHVASGAGRVGGQNPQGGTAASTQPGHTPGRPRSAFDVLRETPYITGGYPTNQ